MTYQGGANNYGTIFEYNTKTGKYTVLYSFKGYLEKDGEYPAGNLIVKGENLYGMTFQGGANDYGTIFEFNIKTGQYTLLYSFKGNPDGALPFGSLVIKGENLYGMTTEGGTDGPGTVFEFNIKTGQCTVLHSFWGDGAVPFGSLVLSGENLYGMTIGGGAYNNGLIFMINTQNGELTELYSFKGGTEDGKNPFGNGPILSGKTLYGMTSEGGANNYGTIFKFNTNTLQMTLLHSFGTVTGDGQSPSNGNGLILAGKTLCGMTLLGGTDNYGTIFSFNVKTGQYEVLHGFTGVTTDGANPLGSLLLEGENLYGMTVGGGAEGGGTIFSFSLK
jgi:uncharacterized repeat protein (TIGR03803 family)